MKSLPYLTMTVLFATVVIVFAVRPALAQDAAKVDPKHYKIELENDQVRVLRITYGPHEKSVMHDHPSGVITFLTEAHVKFAFPDGKSQEKRWKTGESSLAAAGKHLPDNLGDKPFEAILVELKARPVKAEPTKK